MDERILNLINSLSNKLLTYTVEFITKNLNEYEETNTVVSLLLSSHISSLILSLKAFIRQCDTDPRNIVIMDKFCMEILEAFNQIDHVINIQPIIDKEH